LVQFIAALQLLLWHKSQPQTFDILEVV